MAQFMTDFSEYNTGMTPDDWIDAWVPGGQRLEVVKANGALGGKALEHEIFKHDRRAWAWMKVPRANEVEVLARLRCDHVAARAGIIARGRYGDSRDTTEGWTSELFNGAYREQSPHEVDIQERRTILNTISYNPREEANRGLKRPHGIGLTRGTGFYPWAPREWHWIRLQLRDLDGFVAMRARAWNDLDDEPIHWQHDNDRTEPSIIGKFGFVGITGQRTDGIRQYDFFSVGTNGDPAPMVLADLPLPQATAQREPGGA